MESTHTSSGSRAIPRPCMAARRFRSQGMFLIVMLLSFGMSACTDDSAQQLFDNAQFEERQNNQAHAQQLYQEILIKYPKSEYARKAEERLREVAPKK